jgi:hypothetical protein
LLAATALISLVLAATFVADAQDKASSQARWKISSIKICRSRSGAIVPTIQALGSYPVYTFFIPRPVWTVNGTVVEAKPVYEKGRLVAFQLMDAAAKLNPGTKNTLKFALPDHNGSCTFLYDHSQIPPGECYEFF